MRRLISSISRQRRLSVMKYRSWSRKARRKSSMLKIKENIPLAPLTTFEIGGTARYMTEARKDDDIREATRWAKEKNVRLVVLAGGSNVLVPDEGLGGNESPRTRTRARRTGIRRVGETRGHSRHYRRCGARQCGSVWPGDKRFCEVGSRAQNGGGGWG